MSVAVSSGSNGEPLGSAAGVSPRSIRGRLLLEEVGAFDREYRQVMARATEDLDLTPGLEMLEQWEWIARLTDRDPEAHRRALQTATRLNAGEDVPMTEWSEVKQELGL